MKIIHTIFLLSFFNFSTLFSQTIYPDYWDGKIYLKIKDDTNNVLPLFDIHKDDLTKYPFFQTIIKEINLQKIYRPFTRIKTPTFQNTYQIEFSDAGKIDFVLKELAKYSIVEYVERIPIYRSFYNPNDPYANNSDQWFLDKIEAYDAWDLVNTTNTEVVVAIVDDAVRWDHEDLEDNMWINQTEYNGFENFDDDGNGYIDDIIGWDAANWDNNPIPPSSAENFFFSHGTHCAGIANGVTDNNNGIASVSFNQAKIMACKSALDDPPTNDNGQILFTNTSEGIEYASQNNADIISCSFGGSGYSTTFQNLINQAFNNGSIIVAAAGNDGLSSLFYPAAYNNVISVANSDQYDVKNSSSNYGNWVDITAPGTSILSSVATTNFSYEIYNGTSMSCPMVAGLLALMKSQSPNSSNDDLISCLFSSADNIDAQNPNYIGLLGAGRINAKQALECLNGGGNTQNITLYEPIIVSPSIIVCDEPFTVQTNFVNLSSNTFVGEYGAYLYDINENPIDWVQILTENAGLQSGYVYTSSLEFTNTGLDLTEGDYFVGLFYRPSGSSDWVTVNDGDYSNFLPVTVTCGDPCASPLGLNADDQGYAFISLDWSNISDGISYQTRMREAGNSNWNEGNFFVGTGVIWGNMVPCTQYEFQVKTICNSGESNYSSSIFATTEGCGDTYCYSYGLTWDDWIAGVTFNTINNTSGKDYGFGNYTNLSTDVTKGENYNITLTPDTDDNSETVYWRVWIDFNQDDDFTDNGEQVFQTTGNNTNTESGVITIPTNALSGNTRMRVSMNLDGYTTACETGSYREVEDYSLFIENSCDTPSQPSITASGSTNLCPGENVSITASNVCSACNVIWSTGQIGNTIIINSNQIVSATNQNDCGTSSSSNQLVVTQEELPSQPSITSNGSTNLCPGENITLSVFNLCDGCSVLWSNGQTGNFITVNNNETVSAIAQNTCGTSSSSNQITVTQEELPSQPSITSSGSTNLCPGENVSIMVSNVCSGCNVIWSTGQTGNTIIINSNQIVSATNQNDCGLSSSSNQITVTQEELPSQPSITSSGSTNLCPGENVTLNANNICDGCSVFWSNGQTGNFITVNTQADYFAYVVGGNCNAQSLSSNSIAVTVDMDIDEPMLNISGSQEICEEENLELSVINLCNDCAVLWSNEMTGQTIIVELAGTYNAIVTNNCGTQSVSPSVTISISSLPPQPQISPTGSLEICSGQSINLTATGCSNCNEVIWSNGMNGSTIIVSESGNYTATYVNDCGVSLPSGLTEITVTAYIPEITVNNQCSLAAPSGTNHQWFFNGNYIGDGQFWIATETGYYTISMTNFDNCEGISEPLFIDGCVTALNEFEVISKFEIFPNPASNFIYVNAKLPEGEKWVLELFNTSGQLIKVLGQSTLKQSEFSQQYSLKELDSGVYIVKYTTDQGQLIEKLVITH